LLRESYKSTAEGFEPNGEIDNRAVFYFTLPKNQKGDIWKI